MKLDKIGVRLSKSKISNPNQSCYFAPKVFPIRTHITDMIKGY